MCAQAIQELLDKLSDDRLEALIRLLDMFLTRGKAASDTELKLTLAMNTLTSRTA